MMLMSKLLTWRDIAKQFKCGRNKALKILHEVGCVKVGRTPYITEDSLLRYIAEHGEIRINWKY